MRTRPARSMLWFALVALGLAAGVPGCSSLPEEDVRTVCEWVLMDSQIFEAFAGVDRATQRLTEVAELQTTQLVMLISMKAPLRDLLKEYEGLEAAIVDMRSDFRSPTVLEALTEVQTQLDVVQDSLNECIEIIESSTGDPALLSPREPEYSAAVDRMLRAADAIEHPEAGSQMLDSAARVLERLG